MMYFGRCMHLVDNVDHYYVVKGPSLSNKEAWKFFVFLNGLDLPASLFSFLPELKLNFTPYDIIISLIMRLNDNEASLLQQASYDSIMRRNLTAKIFYKNKIIRLILSKLYFLIGKVLILKYSRLIHHYSISHACTSHLNYIEYTSLIIACSRNTIPCISIMGGIAQAIKVNKVSHPTLHYGYYLQALSNIYCARRSIPINSTNLADSNNSLAYSFINKPNPFLDIHDKKYTLIIVAHCFGDNNYVSDSRYMLFPTYYDWISETLKLLSLHADNYSKILFKIHPHSAIYKENNILDPLLNSARRVIGSKFSIVESTQSVDQYVDLAEDLPLVCTFHGRVTVELGCLGIPVLACGKALGPNSAQLNPSSLTEYFDYISTPSKLAHALQDKSKMDSMKEDSFEYKQLLLDSQLNDPVNDEATRLILSIKDYFDFQSIKSHDIDYLKSTLLSLSSKPHPPLFHYDSSWSMFITKLIK